MWKDGDVQITPPGSSIAGEPALFFSKGERDWRNAIASVGAQEIRALALRFTVASYKRRGHSFDIDNLCKPVLDELRWKPDTIWARVEVGEEPGLLIFDAPPPPAPATARLVDIATPPSRSARTTGIPELMAESVLGGGEEDVGIELAFHSPETRIEDFGFEGPIKPLIDGMFVVLGGAAHRPSDHRIKDLRIRRGVAPDRLGVTITIWLLDS